MPSREFKALTHYRSFTSMNTRDGKSARWAEKPRPAPIVPRRSRSANKTLTESVPPFIRVKGQGAPFLPIVIKDTSYMSRRSNVIPPLLLHSVRSPGSLSVWSLIDRVKVGRFYRIEATFRERFVLKMISSRLIRGDTHYEAFHTHTRARPSNCKTMVHLLNGLDRRITMS